MIPSVVCEGFCVLYLLRNVGIKQRQVFTGSGLLKVCGTQNLHRSPMFVLDEGLGALTQLGLTGAPDKVSDMILEYQAMFTSLWSTGTFRKDLAKDVNLLP